jgi:hypothetical protein
MQNRMNITFLQQDFTIDNLFSYNWEINICIQKVLDMKIEGYFILY